MSVSRSTRSTPELDTSYSASVLCRSTQRYNQWCEAVDLDPIVREYQPESSPEAVKKILLDSCTIPSWIWNEESPEYQHYQPDFQANIGILSDQAAESPDLQQDEEDTTLSRQVCLSLLPIFSIVKREHSLGQGIPAPTEADRRAAVDGLGIHTWEVQPGTPCFYRVESTLQLPRTMPMQVYDMKADSAVFIELPLVDLSGFGPTVQRALSSLSHSSAFGYLRLLHVVIEYKCDQSLEIATRQVTLGLVSGVYQRRAFGFPHHLVFGVVHHSMSLLDVLAASWGPFDTPVDAEVNLPAGERHPTECQGEPKRVNEAVGDSRDVLPEASSARKIVVYRLGTFHMGTAISMLQFYLLMRSLRHLAQNYQDEVAKDTIRRLREQKQRFSEHFDWPSPPKPATDGGSGASGSGGKKQQYDPMNLEVVHEHPERSMDRGADDLDRNPISDYVGQLHQVDSDEKVRMYLRRLGEESPTIFVG